jgi:hypothetical protein
MRQIKGARNYLNIRRFKIKNKVWNVNGYTLERNFNLEQISIIGCKKELKLLKRIYLFFQKVSKILRKFKSLKTILKICKSNKKSFSILIN